MKVFFEPKRFARYFVFDIFRAWSNFGLSLVIYGSLPIMITLFYLLFNGFVSEGDFSISKASAVIAFFFLLVTGPTKIYGFVTDRRRGSEWIAIPVSNLERTISMLLLIGVVLPLCLICFLTASNFISSLLIPEYGPVLVSLDYSIFTFDADSGLNFSLSNKMSVWFCLILAFNLGALFFKKNKAGKTFIILLVVSFLFITILWKYWSADLEMYVNHLETATKTIPPVLAVALCVVSYFRIKTLKY